jgi:hypothetical protein
MWIGVSDTVTVNEIPAADVCMMAGTCVLFDLTTGHTPVYVVDCTLAEMGSKTCSVVVLQQVTRSSSSVLVQ